MAKNIRKYPNAVRKTYRYAHGASYCISWYLMKKLEKYFRGESSVATCNKIGRPDDMAMGAIIG